MSTATEILIISDLHLSADQPAVIKLFEKFIQQRAVNCSALYILGDFFEYWLGDDDPATELQAIFDCFSLLAEKNIAVYFMHGNRDFLVQKSFEPRCFCQLIDDPYYLTINDQNLILMHGDSLCTDDVDYQAFKQKVRSKEWIHDFLSKSLQERKETVEMLRTASKSETSMKKETIMDVNQQSVLAAFEEHQTRWLIHGHTHRPGVHHYQNNDQQLTRIVLGDWHTSGSYISLKSRPEQPGFDVELETFD